MSTYNVFCDCDSEFAITLESEDIPAYCCICGEAIDSRHIDVVQSNDDEFDDWNRISDELLDDIEDWESGK